MSRGLGDVYKRQVGESNGVLNTNRSDLALDFKDPDTLSYSGTNFTESVGNDGSISNVLTVTVSGDTFTGTDNVAFDGTKVSFGNVPTGLSGLATKRTDTTVEISLTGSATNNRDADDVSTLTCLLYTSPSPRDKRQSRMPSSA